MVQLHMCMRKKKKIKKQKGICIFVWMMSVYSESMEEKTSDAIDRAQFHSYWKDHMAFTRWDIFYLSDFFN